MPYVFPSRADATPIIYAYSDTRYPGTLKVGYTTRDINERMKEHYPTITPGQSWKVEYTESAMKADGSTFMDHDVHAILQRMHIPCVAGEWYRCSVSQVRSAVLAVKTGKLYAEGRNQTFAMRPEQQRAVNMTLSYFASARKDQPDRAPKFLWNAKMRFGKTFASYQLAKAMGATRVLVLTFKPAVEAAWQEDLETHVDFDGWQFICRGGMTYEEADLSRPIVCFGSFQDFLGTNDAGGIKAKNEWVHTTNWDLVIFDEYHFGAWRENAKKLFDIEDEDDYDSLDVEKYKKEEADNAYNETFLPITTNHYLFLSGTPFRAINSGEFIEEQVFNWTYSDEQREKAAWKGPNNPYAALPRMVMLTYKMPEEIRRIAQEGEFDEFDLNVFFSAKGKGDEAKFVYESYVQKWLDLMHGDYAPASLDEMKVGAKPAMPYSDASLRRLLSHTLWFLPNVASCYAMRNLLMQRQNTFYHDYKINVCAGTQAGVGLDALAPVQNSMANPLESKTITLSCGKLTTGVTVRPWTGIFMLRNLSSPETYFQAAFRVQSPWTTKRDDGSTEIVKTECYVIDFALNRALKQIADYSCRLDVNEDNPEKKVQEFVNFLPVIAYADGVMRPINAEEILDITMAGTSATLLAKRWESALLVNVDNETLERLMSNTEAMEALMRIEGFRTLNQDLETIINKSEHVKKTKKEKGDNLTPKEKKEISDEEKEYKSKRKQIQEKLIKFATRVPIFMYLTDYRERTLKDVITQLEPGLFKKVTGLSVKDFELLVSLGVFNGPLMNDAIYKFKRYEDSSLQYTGIDRHNGEDIGLWDTVVSNIDYMTSLQQKSMIGSVRRADDVPQNPFAFIAPDDDEDDEDDRKPVRKQKPAAQKQPAPKQSQPTPVLPPRPIAPQPARPATAYPYASFGRPLGRPEPVQPAKKDEPPKDYSAYKPGVKVQHKSFGEGVITMIKDGRLFVRFGKAEKMFQYPSAIDSGFIKLL